MAVLPGSYAFSTGLPYVSYGSKNVVLVKSPFAEANTYNIQSQLTNAGKKAAVSAAKKSYNKCLKAHSLTPKNCPQKFNSKYRYDKSTITWTEAGRSIPEDRGDIQREPSSDPDSARPEAVWQLHLSGAVRQLLWHAHRDIGCRRQGDDDTRSRPNGCDCGVTASIGNARERLRKARTDR